MERRHNFNPGLAALPLQVLQEGQGQFVDFRQESLSLNILTDCGDMEMVGGA